MWPDIREYIQTVGGDGKPCWAPTRPVGNLNNNRHWPDVPKAQIDQRMMILWEDETTWTVRVFDKDGNIVYQQSHDHPQARFQSS